MAGVVTFLSDYGLRDEFVGVVHGVIARIAPGVRVIDVTHGIPPHDVRAGALALARAVPFLPAGVHLAVVDPGVGGARRPVALRARDGRLLVGPDNGLLAPAAARVGGIAEAVELSASPWRLEPVSATFHGRDLFAPVAARLASGAVLAEAGLPLDPAGLVTLELPGPRAEPDGSVRVDVVSRDVYGNLQLGAEGLAALGLAVGGSARVGIAGREERVACVRSFVDVGLGELLLHDDATGAPALAVNGGSAAERLDLEPGDELVLRPWPA